MRQQSFGSSATQTHSYLDTIQRLRTSGIYQLDSADDYVAGGRFYAAGRNSGVIASGGRFYAAGSDSGVITSDGRFYAAGRNSGVIASPLWTLEDSTGGVRG